MFTTFEPGALFIEAHLLDGLPANVKPYVIRSVLTPDPLTVPRVGLDAHTLPLPLARFSYSLDPCVALALHILLDEVLEARVGRSGRGPHSRLGSLHSDRKELESLYVGHGAQMSTGRHGPPRQVRPSFGFFVRPQAPKSRAAVYARVYDLGPRGVFERQENLGPQSHSLRSADDEVRPMHVQTRFYEISGEGSRGGSGHQTPTRIHHGKQPPAYIQGALFAQFLLVLEIQVYKKFKPFSFLLDNIEFLSSKNRRNIFGPKGVQVRLGDVELSAVHEHVRRRCRTFPRPSPESHTYLLSAYNL